MCAITYGAREEKGIASVLEAGEHQSLDPGLSKDCQLEQDPTTNGDPEMVHPPGRTLLRLKASKGVPQIVRGLNRFQNRRPRMATLTRLGVLGAQESFGESVFTLELRPPRT